MINLSDAVSLLRAKRKELSDQLAAVDKALAAMSATDCASATPAQGNPQETARDTAGEILPTRLKPPRTLSDEHRHALKEGQRKARHSKEALAGRAREMLDPRPGLAPTTADVRGPRLVKQTRVGGSVMTGTIRTIRIDKGFGFIRDDAGKDYFFHQSAIYGEGIDNLREGDSVEFDVGQGPKGLRAENVRRTST